MRSPNATQITCPYCRQPFSAAIEQLIDTSRDPQGKTRLLSGRINTFRCPNCGQVVALTTPLVYHDPDKELLIVYVPMELGLPHAEQERVVGSFVTAITNSLPPERRKAYLLTPKTALSQQGMIETILEADGITREMIDAQRAKMGLVETFLQTEPDKLPDLITQHDAEIDAEFFTLMLAAAESAAAAGQRDVAESILRTREEIITHSTFGQQALAQAEVEQQAMDEVRAAVEALGPKPTHNEVLNMLLNIVGEDVAQNDVKLQVLVGVLRPAFDYQFLQRLSERIDKAKGKERTRLEAIRKRLVELLEAVDRQNEAVVRRATDTLRTLLNSPDIDQAIESNLDALDELFLQVLSYNIQAAEQGKDVGLSARLKQIYEKVVGALQSTAPPELQFIGDLLNVESFEAVQQEIAAHAAEFGPSLLNWIDTLAEDLSSRESPQTAETLDRLGRIRDEVERTLASQPAAAPASTESVPNPSPAPSRPSLILTSSKSQPNPPPSGGEEKPKIEILRGGKYTPLRPK